MGITEYHLCKECEHGLYVPSFDYNVYECICLKNSSQIHKDGGLTACPYLKKNNNISGNDKDVT